VGGGNKKALNTNSLVWAAVAVGAAAGTAVGIWYVLSESSSAPNN